MGKKSEKEDKNPAPPEPESEEKKRLHALAFSRKLLRRGTPSQTSSPLDPSGAVVKLDGRDIVKRGQRKSRYLFSFPGLLAPLSGGRVGELADLGTKNPLLYLEFPQGRMKLFGTHVYPKNKYLTLQLTRSSKGVVCEDSFDSMIVFSDAWWIGLKEENPEEFQLDFPKEFKEGKPAECDFKGGAGAASGDVSGGNKSGKEYIEPISPDFKDDLLDEPDVTNRQDTENLLESTPVRQSARTAGKMLSYAEPTSDDDPVASDAEVSEAMEEVDIRSGNSTRRSIFGKTEDSSPATSSLVASETEFIEKKVQSTGKKEQSSLSSKSKENPSAGGTLVQATLSTLFEKVVKNKTKRSANNPPGPKGSPAKRQRLSSKQTNDQEEVKGSTKKATPSKKATSSIRKKSGTGTASSRKKSKVQVEEPDESSSDPQDDSDEEWNA